MPRPLPDRRFQDVVAEWDYKFTCVEIPTVFELILAANYLDIPGLADLCCARVASEIRGRSVEEIRALFQIENDFTPEEEKQIREENRWCDPE
ncbi:putative Skp1 family protein [Gregarina niphandrodes]|uniref:Skp1 family protein n=1 Tax=Gregarina niphandrodes TaxID=110365 RepID=A0A023B104_GRENI|nr:putative Skp1 family protein [Gregarina niphandrodes]EZG45864.1 putative Skp1 family protein [Gregarina niphandrodes]|eukprot:XP_011132436.1 putative Skp1 family protein [Gregarina niphandrodes]